MFIYSKFKLRVESEFNQQTLAKGNEDYQLPEMADETLDPLNILIHTEEELGISLIDNVKGDRHHVKK